MLLNHYRVAVIIFCVDPIRLRLPHKIDRIRELTYIINLPHRAVPDKIYDKPPNGRHNLDNLYKLEMCISSITP